MNEVCPKYEIRNTKSETNSKLKSENSKQMLIGITNRQGRKGREGRKGIHVMIRLQLLCGLWRAWRGVGLQIAQRVLQAGQVFFEHRLFPVDMLGMAVGAVEDPAFAI